MTFSVVPLPDRNNLIYFGPLTQDAFILPVKVLVLCRQRSVVLGSPTSLSNQATAQLEDTSLSQVYDLTDIQWTICDTHIYEDHKS